MRTLLPILSLLTIPVLAQQVPDDAFHPVIEHPMHVKGRAPLVKVDEGHHNFHTLQGGYRVFGRVLEADGYRVAPFAGAFSPGSLQGTDVLVIANAIQERNRNDWNAPAASAFDSGEVAVVKQWVLDGGALFLVADHMPFAGAAQDLAQTFGIHFLNCYALDERQRALDRFDRADGLDGRHPIIHGEGLAGRVDTVVTFTGSAFQLPDNADPLVSLTKDHVLWEPAVPGEFPPSTPQRSALGWHQGACMNYGKGRIVVFGEAAMFTGQLVGPDRRPMGLNVPEASGNITLLRNIVAWLTAERL